MKNLGRLLPEKAILFNCDIQAGFAKHAFGSKSVITTARQIAQTAKVLKIPALVTVQNTRIFGDTVPEILEDLDQNNYKLFEKTSFSMVNDDTLQYLKQFPERNSVILYGLETHVCVQQTTFDLLNMGYDVHLLTDGVSSIKEIDRKTAIRRLEQSGVYLTTSQSLIFELLRDHTHPAFKQILPILKMERDSELINF